MRIASKFDGTCSLCGRSWSVGDEIEYRKNCASICTGCAAAGHVPPEKDSAFPASRGSTSTAPAPDGAEVKVLAETARRIEKLLADVLAEIRAARQQSAQPSGTREAGF